MFLNPLSSARVTKHYAEVVLFVHLSVGSSQSSISRNDSEVRGQWFALLFLIVVVGAVKFPAPASALHVMTLRHFVIIRMVLLLLPPMTASAPVLQPTSIVVGH